MRRKAVPLAICAGLAAVNLVSALWVAQLAWFSFTLFDPPIPFYGWMLSAVTAIRLAAAGWAIALAWRHRSRARGHRLTTPVVVGAAAGLILGMTEYWVYTSNVQLSSSPLDLLLVLQVAAVPVMAVVLRGPATQATS